MTKNEDRYFPRVLVAKKGQISKEYLLTESNGSTSFLILKYAQDVTGCKDIKVNMFAHNIQSLNGAFETVYYITVDRAPLKRTRNVTHTKGWFFLKPKSKGCRKT